MLIHLLDRMNILGILVTLLIATSVKSATFPNCDLQEDGVSIAQIHKIEIQDNAIGPVLELSTTGVVGAELANIQDKRYFDFSFEQNIVTLSVSTDYNNVEEEVPSGDADTILKLEIDLNCGSAHKIFLDVVVIDNNNKPTELTTEIIAYNIPLPLPAKVPLYLFTSTPTDNKLTARDADISNNIIIFELDPADKFEITAIKDTRDPLGKTFVASISAKNPITSLDVNSYKIIAKDKDSRDPADIQITITVDDEASLPASPNFGEKYYEAEYLVSETGEHTFTDVSLGLVNPPSHTIVPELDQGGIGNFFSVGYDAGSKAVVVTKDTNLTPEILEENNFLTLWVQVSYLEFPDIPSTSVSVLITLPSKGESGAQAFEDAVYIAAYNTDDNTVTPDKAITVTITDLVIDIEDSELSEHFQVEITPGNPSIVEIKVQTPLPPAEIEVREYISFVLTAKVEELDHGSTVIIIDIPATECPAEPSANVFSETLYKGQYTITPTGLDTVITDIIAVTSTDVLTVVIEPNVYPDNFVINDADLTNIKLELTEDLSDDVLNDNEVLSLILVAKSTDGSNKIFGSSVVILDLPPGECPVGPTYAFSNSLYKGTYSTDPPTVSTEPITATAVEQLVIDIKESDFKKYFALDPTVVLPDVKIILNVLEPIPEEVIDANDFMTLVLTAKGSATSNDYGEAGLVIALPSKPPTGIVDNVFEESIYEGIYDVVDGTPTLTITGDIKAESQDQMEIEFMLSEFEKYFLIDFTSPPLVLITVKEAIPEVDVDANDYITLVLNAKSTDDAIDYGKTALVINLPEKECTIEPSDDIFAGTVGEWEYVVDVSGTHSVSVIKTISVIPDDVAVSIVGDYVDNFDVEVEPGTKQVLLTIETNLPEDTWTENRYLSILLQGTSGALTGAARIILALPEPECQNPDPEPSITFVNGPYVLNAGDTGKIATLVATFDPPEPHTFSITKQPGWVVLVGDDMNIADNAQLKPGIFNLIATVTGDVSQKNKDAEITIYVKANNAGVARTAYSMMVLSIKEEVVSTEMLDFSDEDIGGEVYEYVIQSQVPDEPKMFELLPSADKKFLTSIAIDRENSIFDGHAVPQVVLEISLQKKPVVPDTSNLKSMLATHPLFKYMHKRQNRDGAQCLMLNNEILRLDHIIHIPVIIEDENDNAPVFTTPSVVIGYPTNDIVFDINPPYLFKVEATDKDDGINAKITYSSTSTSIKVNPDTGVVYPTEGLYNGAENVPITITASDGKNPADPEFTANVILLDEDHVSVLVFSNLDLDGLDAKLKELSNAINVVIWSLTSGTLPPSQDSRLRADADLQLKAIVYAIDVDKAVSHDDLKEKLAGRPEVTVIEYTPGVITGPGSGDNSEDDCDDTGLIAGISVLAVALVVCIVGFIVFYCKKRKSNGSLDLEQIPEHKTSFKKSNASHNGFNNELVLKDVSTRRPTQHPMEAPKIDPDSSNVSSSSSSEDGEDFDEARERRKSVTFNEETEHFDITAKENETDSIKVEETENKEET